MLREYVIPDQPFALEDVNSQWVDRRYCHIETNIKTPEIALQKSH